MLFLSILFTSIGFGLQVLFKHLQEKLIITEVGYVNNVMCVIIIIIIISIISKGCKGPLIEVLNTFRKFSFQYLWRTAVVIAINKQYLWSSTKH